ncbi:MAG: nickel-responsive transcriptional regulator NikR [Candidatus Omnitrophica bacterium]|nr:nickel-responsive transcriptional regulator NikR [Candidatus Omnitrophota bacterium]
MKKEFRFGVSLPQELIEEFDKLIKKKGYTNRSKALADLIREELIKKEWEEEEESVGIITLLYNHHKRQLMDKIVDLQHNFCKIILTDQHIHLDHNNCLEIVAVRGKPKEIKKLADTLKAIKGVKNVGLSISSTGKNLP